MALNFADLFEHAADAFADRTAVACADRQVTHRELDERTSRLAHHLAGLGIGPGDHVGLYARNSIEALETLIAACKLRAAAVNINYRYVENELNYMFADSDLTALVYDRLLAPLVTAAGPAAPGLRALVEIDDGSEPAPTTPSTTMFAEVDGKRYAVPGDMARVEDDGTVTLLGRGNTCVNAGGEKVFPEEVQGALKSHPGVFDALVIRVPDERLGQRVAALVQPRPGAAADLGALQEHVRRQVAGYKVPRSIWLAETIRRTVSGKADYAWAREYAASHDPGLDRVSGAHSPTAPR